VTREEIRQAVIGVLTELQELRGKEVPDMDDATCPMEDLEGFDSVSAVEATTRLEEEMDLELDAKLFWEKGDDKPLRVDEIVDRICGAADVERVR
jgi:acyl carrier protein